MCNACGFQCCAYDGFDKCGCNDCDCPECWDDEELLGYGYDEEDE